MTITRTTRHEDLPEWLRVREVAAIWDVSPSTIYALIARAICPPTESDVWCESLGSRSMQQLVRLDYCNRVYGAVRARQGQAPAGIEARAQAQRRRK